MFYFPLYYPVLNDLLSRDTFRISRLSPFICHPYQCQNKICEVLNLDYSSSKVRMKPRSPKGVCSHRCIAVFLPSLPLLLPIISPNGVGDVIVADGPLGERKRATGIAKLFPIHNTSITSPQSVLLVVSVWRRTPAACYLRVRGRATTWPNRQAVIWPW